MARTKWMWILRRRVSASPRKNATSSVQMSKFELTMRKYYPKKSRFLYQGMDYQASDANNYENANSRVLQRYKRSFFGTFAADASSQTPQPSKIPTNFQCLKIYEGSNIFLKKLIKQNKNLKHIIIKSEDKEMNAVIVRYLRYSRNLGSITFQYLLPYFSERDCQKMLKTWGKTLETFTSLGFLQREYLDNCESFKRVMETILEFPKLQSFELKESVKKVGEYFPFDKLQERNISYRIGFVTEPETLESLKENYPQFRPTGLVGTGSCFTMGYHDYSRFQKDEKQILFLQPQVNSQGASIFLFPVFENILALDLRISGIKIDLSRLGQLTSLKHLALEFLDDVIINTIDYLFEFLNKNVATHKKLETFELEFRSKNTHDRSEYLEELKRKKIVKFFNTCSESLRVVHFKFKYPNKRFMDFEYFYEGLSKLKNVQSLSLILDFQALDSKKKVEKLCKIISNITSLEKLDFKIRKGEYQEKKINLKFPPQLKELSLGMDTSSLLFDASKTLCSLPNLTRLELEFSDFSSQKWKNLIQSTLDKLSLLETFTIKSYTESKKIK